MMILTIKNLKKKELIPILLSLPKQAVFSLEEVMDDAPTGKASGKKASRAGPDSKLTLTGKHATKGSNREAILLTFEKIEVKFGIGNVTRKMLRAECERKGQDAQIIYQLIREGYMKTL